MIKVRETRLAINMEKVYIVEDDINNTILICRDISNLINNIYQVFLFPNLYNIDFNLNEEVIESSDKYIIYKEEIINSKWFGLINERKLIEEKEYYYESIILNPNREIKLGLVDKFFYKSSINEYKLREEFRDTFKFDDLCYYISPYLYCLNLLDWKDIDFWAEKTLKTLIKQ